MLMGERVGCRNRPGVGPKVDALRALYRGQKIIVGREKLDVSKGVLEKVRFPLPLSHLRL